MTAPASSPRSPTRSSAPCSTPTCPPAGAYAVGMAYLPDDDAERARRRGPHRGDRRRARACGSSPGATCRSTPDLVGRGRPRVHAVLPPALRRRPTRGLTRHRARPGRVLPAQARRARGRGLLPVAVGPHRRLQGHAHHRPARAVLPRPVRRALRLRAGAGALALLDQHLPELAAGPPLPAHRAQRRDQHRQGQPQLDAGPREPDRAPTLFPGDLDRVFPICTPGASDSATFDEVLELLHLGGRSLPHAVLMMIPEAWENHESMDPARRAFYEFHSTFMEPWDGPACVTFTDGTLIGAVLDRNGLRPGRYWVTDDGLVVLASEAGVLDLEPERVVRRGRLQPGRMFLVDTAAGRIVSDEEVKSDPRRREPLRGVAARRPDRAWPTCPSASTSSTPPASVARRQRTFGYTEEELKILLAPMAAHRRRGARLDGHRHPDRGALGAAAAALRLLHPALRPGDQPAARRHPRGARHLARHARSAPRATSSTPPRRTPARSCCPSRSSTTTSSPRSCTSTPTATCPATAPSSSRAPTTSPAARPRCAPGCTRSSPRCRPRSATAPASSCSPTATPTATSRRSRRCCSPRPCTTTSSARRPAPRSACSSRPATCARCTTWPCSSATAPRRSTPTSPWRPSRTWCGTGAITAVTEEKAVANLIKALGKGVLKVMSKMGISTVASYRGAQVFEAIGLSQDLVDEYFTGTVSQLGGVGPRRHRRRDRGPARAGLPARRHPAGAPQAARRRRVPVAPRGRAAPVRPRHRLPAPARHAGAALRRLQAVHRADRRAVRAADDAARALRARRRRAAPAGADRRGRAGQRDRPALQHRRDELRLDQHGGARDPRHRDEPAQGPLQHRRGRRGPRAPAWTPSAARRSSRSRPAASASPRSTSPTPTTSRSRWRRAPSRGRAASCPGPRSTRGSPGPGTRRRGSA